MDFRCAEKEHEKNRSKDDGNPTATSIEQEKVEKSVAECINHFRNCLNVDLDIPELHRTCHELFLTKGLSNLSQSYDCLDASRPWIVYWIIHSMELLEIPIPDKMASHICDFLSHCQCPEGGFAGGPGQLAHLAPTYAAVNALCILATEEAYDVIDRAKLQSFLMSRRLPDGSFTMHEGGEIDIRGVYCAASAARLTNIATPQMFENTANWLVGCQTYEGGFAGFPGQEAHGGYSFCGLAALILLGHEKLCDTQSLLRWTANKQMAFEGGFQGRTNKLVDGCYSFWQGGAFPLLHMVLAEEGEKSLSAEKWMFDQGALQEYLLVCCQHSGGGLIDKPGKSRDYYHTCYCLSGLSMAQHLHEGKLEHTHVIGKPDNEVKRTHPLFNIGLEPVSKANLHFASLPIPEYIST